MMDAGPFRPRPTNHHPTKRSAGGVEDNHRPAIIRRWSHHGRTFFVSTTIPSTITRWLWCCVRGWVVNYTCWGQIGILRKRVFLSFFLDRCTSLRGSRAEQSSFVEVNNWIGNNDARVLLIFETDAVKRFTLFRLTVRYFAHGGFFHCWWVLKCGAAEECFQSTIKSFLSSLFCGVAHTGRNHTNDSICAVLLFKSCVIFCLAKHSLHEFPLN